MSTLLQPNTRRPPGAGLPVGSYFLPRDSAGAAWAAGVLTATTPTAAALVAQISGRLSRVVVLGVAAAAMCAGLLVLAMGLRSRSRRNLLADVTEKLATPLGFTRPVPGTVRARRWGEGWVGSPARLDLTPHPRTVEADTAELARLAGQVLGRTYRVDQKKRRRSGDLRLVRVARKDEPAEVEQTRGEEVLREVLGESTKVTVDRDDEGKPTGYTATVGPKYALRLGNRAYRAAWAQGVIEQLPDPDTWRMRPDLPNGRVRFEERPELPIAIPRPRPSTDPDRRYRIPLGVTEHGVVSWNLGGTGPHFMVAGATGGGKTVVMNGALMEIAHRGWPVRIVDPKRVEFKGVRGYPNVEIVASTIEDQMAVIYRTWAEMERRYAAIEADEIDEGDLEPLVLVLDEYPDFVLTANAWWKSVKPKGMPAECPIHGTILRLVLKARLAGIRLILAVQRGDVRLLGPVGGALRENFGTRLTVGQTSKDANEMMWGTAHTGVTIPKDIPGRGTAASDNGDPVEAQVYWTPDPRRPGYRSPLSAAEDRQLLAALRPPEVNHPPVEVSLATDEHPDNIWQAITESRLIPTRGTTPAAAASAPDPEPGPRPQLTLITPSEHPPRPAAPAATAEDAVEETVCAEDLLEGDQVLVDAAADLWAVLEDDALVDDDDDSVTLEWRCAAAEAGTLVVPIGHPIPTRRVLTEGTS